MEEEGSIPIRVRLYGRPLLLPEEVMEETLENSSVCIGDWAAKLGNRGGTMGQAYKCQV